MELSFMKRRINKDGKGAVSLLLTMVIVVVLLTIALAGVYYLNRPVNEGQDIPVVEEGDTVKVDYIGTFEDGRVFDTTLYNVAKDNITYPKAVSFELKEKGLYAPFSFKVGAGSTIKGFDKGVRGLHLNQTITVTIPPSEGYGYLDMSKVKSIPIVQEVPVKESMAVDDFGKKFSLNPQVGLTVTDPFWGWNITVMAVSDEMVTYYNMPTLHQTVTPYGNPEVRENRGWYCDVISIDSTANNGTGLIEVKNLVTKENINVTGGTDQNGQIFTILNVDEKNGIISLNYNKEVVGKTLIFKLTVVDIQKGTTTTTS